MTKLKNKDVVYVLLRHDFDGKDVVIACSDRYEKIQELEWEAQQAFIDKGISMEESYFYTTGTTFYV